MIYPINLVSFFFQKSNPKIQLPNDLLAILATNNQITASPNYPNCDNVIKTMAASASTMPI